MTAIDREIAAALDPSVLAGDWRNTNARGGIERIVCQPTAQGGMTVQCYGRCEPQPRDWGSVEAGLFAFELDGKQAGAFAAVFDLGFEQVRVQANVKLGVLVVVTLNQFRDGSGRANYFNREFFHRSARP